MVLDGLRSSVGVFNCAGYIEHLADCLKAGQIYVEDGTNSVKMAIPANVEAIVEAKQKPGKGEFSLEIS